MNDHQGSDLPPVAGEPLARPQRLIVLALVDAGFRWADAKAWATGWVCDPDPTIVVTQAAAFAAHGGFTVQEAICWHQAAFWMPEAGPWAEAGYTPAQAQEVVRRVSTEGEGREWLSTGLPAHRVIAYLRAGVTARETPTYEDSHNVTCQTLPVMAAFLGN